GNTASYIHNGKIGVLLSTDKKDEELMNDICLHIASSAPEFISRNEIPQSVIDHETEIEMGKEDLQSKPEAIRAKIVEGRVNKLMAGKCLLEQPFIKNPDVTIGQLVEGKMEIKAFTRYMLGEGLEKRQDNFAEEVMAQMNG
ncbi:MAG: translation elongation factor Ts, partial [Candidatus Gastranaerophilales bacterium]|nr:translation elongation factor Ts [Candidatus Gastranaerophilales bacterium]